MYLYDDYIKDLYRILDSYSGLVSVVDRAWSYDGREIYALKLGKGEVKGIVSAGVHGREYINTEVLIRIIEFYAGMYVNSKVYNGIDIRGVFEESGVIIVPLVNPDGYVIATEGCNAINNIKLCQLCHEKIIDHFMWKNNSRGVDINRNFLSKSWKPKSIDDKPMSEVETRFLRSIFDNFGGLIYLDIHSRGENIYYYRNNMSMGYNAKQYIIAKELSGITGYRISEPSEEINSGDSGGNTVHYYSEHTNGYAITIETIPEDEQFPLGKKNVEKVYNQIKDILIWMVTVQPGLYTIIVDKCKN